MCLSQGKLLTSLPKDKTGSMEESLTPSHLPLRSSSESSMTEGGQGHTSSSLSPSSSRERGALGIQSKVQAVRWLTLYHVPTEAAIAFVTEVMALGAVDSETHKHVQQELALIGKVQEVCER